MYMVLEYYYTSLILILCMYIICAYVCILIYIYYSPPSIHFSLVNCSFNRHPAALIIIIPTVIHNLLLSPSRQFGIVQQARQVFGRAWILASNSQLAKGKGQSMVGLYETKLAPTLIDRNYKLARKVSFQKQIEEEKRLVVTY